MRLAVPHAELIVAGTVCEHAETSEDGVTLLGRVESLDAEHRRAAVCLVPLLTGTGLKIKLLDALRFGKATVSTSVGVQGVRDWVTEAVSVADEADAFAAAVVRLLCSPELRKQRECAAETVVRAHFGPGSEQERFLLAALRH